MQRAGKIGGGDRTQFYYKHLIHGMYKIYLDEGFVSLYNGSFARILYHVPNVAISMCILEFMRPKI